MRATPDGAARGWKAGCMEVAEAPALGLPTGKLYHRASGKGSASIQPEYSASVFIGLDQSAEDHLNSDEVVVSPQRRSTTPF